MGYYIKLPSGYYDIVRETLVDGFEQAGYLNNVVQEYSMLNSETTANVTASATITSVKKVPVVDRIQRMAFGNNNDNTCSAVACTLVLNYLDYSNGNIVPSSYHLEALTAQDPSHVATLYPKANAFHRFLTNDCNMGAASYADGIKNGIDNYRQSSATIAQTGIRCEWTLNILTNFGIDELNANRPAMLTSTIAGAYSWHTMPIYGYRRYSDGGLEWLVHTGWYTTLVNTNGVWRMPEVWVPASTATYLYRFRYNGM